MRELRLLGFLVATSLFVGLVAPRLGWASPDFLTGANLRDVLVNAAPFMIAACGMTLVIISGGIDISIGALFAACAVAASATARGEHPLPLAVLAPLGLGLAVGAWNGVLIAVARIPSIVATLGMMTVIRGVTIYLTGSNEVRDLPAAFRHLSLGALFGIPFPLLLAFASVAITALFLSGTKPGREIYALGGNELAAQLSAIPVTRLRLLTHALCGAFVGLAALVHAARFSSVQPLMGGGFELVVITAVVLGGTSILGGSGNVLGSALGAVTLEVIPNALTFLGVPTFWKEATAGAVVLVAVLSSASARR